LYWFPYSWSEPNDCICLHFAYAHFPLAHSSKTNTAHQIMSASFQIFHIHS
jgi:hypothetical protein